MTEPKADTLQVPAAVVPYDVRSADSGSQGHDVRR
jgi:hypothetical protein